MPSFGGRKRRGWARKTAMGLRKGDAPRLLVDVLGISRESF